MLYNYDNKQKKKWCLDDAVPVLLDELVDAVPVGARSHLFWRPAGLGMGYVSEVRGAEK